MNAQVQNQYLNTQIQTANPGELTLMLYNGCIRFMNLAQDAMNKQDIDGRTTYIKKAIAIIDELSITLDMNYELSQNLHSLYAFIKEKLFEANNKMKVDSLVTSLELVKELRDTWVEVLKLAKAAGKSI